jgi:hypothetical protein
MNVYFLRRCKILSAVLSLGIVIVLFSERCLGQSKTASVINMVFSSDAHYGISRIKFRGDSNVSSHLVNAAMIQQMNSIQALTLPQDGGINSGKKAGYIDYVIQTGDIANRMEAPIQSAATSWAQFETDYMQSVKLKGRDGKPAKLLLVPGNHDITNAIGFTKPLKPLTDPTAMVKIYNLMLKPAKPLTNAGYDYHTGKVNYSFNVKGIHMIFITLWPDSAERIWMEKDLIKVAKSTPVIIFTHDQPECESKHFTNPKSPYNMTEENKFQNLTEEHYKEGYIASADDGATQIEQRGFVKFLKRHPNIKAYFHGNSNWNEFYTYHGPDNDVNLKAFRVDSPIKGKFSGKDETLLSFQLISIDPALQKLTVRECLWNTKPLEKDQKVVFGKSETISLRVD